MHNLHHRRHHHRRLRVCAVLFALFCTAGAVPSAEEIAALCNITTSSFLICTDCSVGCGVVCGSHTVSYCNANQTAITQLSLYNNELTAFPVSIGSLRQLTILGLSTNQLTVLPESIGNLQQLNTLGLQNNKLAALPESIGSIQQLSWLSLSKNELTALPESFGSLQQLTTLYLVENQLTALPESFGNLLGLFHLYSEFNQLASLPESIGSLQELYHLVLHSNRLTALPGSFGNLHKLNYLDLSNNQLTMLPQSIRNLTTLSTVLLDGNCLTCSELDFAPLVVRNACVQSEQICQGSGKSSSNAQGVSVVVIIKFLEDVTDPTELQEEIASVLGIDAGLVSVVVVSPTEVEVTIIGSEETAQHLVDIINNGGSGSGDGSGLGLLRKAIDAHIRKDTDDNGSSDDGVDAAPRIALFHPTALVLLTFVINAAAATL